jgi:hypothetical protein
MKGQYVCSATVGFRFSAAANLKRAKSHKLSVAKAERNIKPSRGEEVLVSPLLQLRAFQELDTLEETISTQSEPQVTCQLLAGFVARLLAWRN